jgi:hypothetical protein
MTVHASTIAILSFATFVGCTDVEPETVTAARGDGPVVQVYEPGNLVVPEKAAWVHFAFTPTEAGHGYAWEIVDGAAMAVYRVESGLTDAILTEFHEKLDVGATMRRISSSSDSIVGKVRVPDPEPEPGEPFRYEYVEAVVAAANAHAEADRILVRQLDEMGRD